MPEDIALKDCEQLKEDLPSAPYIFKVRACDTVEYTGGRGRQLVEITEVFQGNGPAVGMQIYLISSKWSLSLFSELQSIGRGFVNIMETDEEYLVFCREQLEGVGDQIPIYPLYLPEEGGFVAPVFSLKEHENGIGTMWGSTTYTSYWELRNNEFFATTDRALEAMESLKAVMLEKYH